MKQAELKKEIDNNAIVEDFNTLVSIMSRTAREKITRKKKVSITLLII